MQISEALVIYEITFVTSPALSFEEILDAIILALKVFEKIISCDSSTSCCNIDATALPSLFIILGYETTLLAPNSPSLSSSLLSIIPHVTALTSV